MEIFFIMLALTVPIFYIWGLVSFVRSTFMKPDSHESDRWERRFHDTAAQNERLQERVKTLQNKLDDERRLRDKLNYYLSYHPDMSMNQFWQEINPPKAPAPVDEAQAVLDEFIAAVDEAPESTMAASIAAQSPKIVEELPVESKRKVKPLPEVQYTEQKAKTEPKRPVEKIVAQTAPEPAFDWANWFSDNAINLLLFAGAFLVVAAVSFFTYSNWGDIPNELKFGGVLTFASAWYVAGMLFNRGESFKTVGITFITIGAILTPFVGVGFHQFILNGDIASIGIVWLITSVFSTVVYTILSLVFQRRYFTYFGTLSILAMLLSLVQVNNAPTPYFILAGSVTALVLLVGRISLRYFPYLDNYMGQDYENSSIGTLLLSLAAGLGVVLFTGEPPFFSLDVFAVGVVTAVYLWVYCSLHFEEYYLLGAQLLTVLMVGHGANSFTNEPMIAMIAMFIAQFALQFILNFSLKSSKQLQDNAHHLSILMASVIYLASLLFPKTALYHYASAAMAFTLMMQLSYYSRRTGASQLYYACVTLSYGALAHALLGMDFKLSLWGFAFITLGLIEIVAASFVKDDHLRRAQLALSYLVMAGSGFLNLLAWTTNDIRWLQSEDIGIAASTAIAALIGLGIISLIEERRSYKLLPYPVHILSAFVGVVYFMTGLFIPGLVNSVWYTALALTVVASFYLAYRHQHHAWLMSCAAIMLYPTLFSVLNSMNLSPFFSPPYGALFVGLAALQVAVAYLPLEKNLRQGVAYVGMLGLGLSSLLYLIVFPANFFSLGASYVALGIYAIVSGYELRREERFFVPLSHLAGIATAMATILIAKYNYIEMLAFSQLGFALMLMILLALFNRHIPQRLSMMSLTASSHIALWYLLQTLGIGMALPYHLALSALHLGAAWMSFINWDNRAAIAKIGIWGMVVFISIAAVLGHPAANQTSLSLIMVWLGLGMLAFFEESQRRLETPLIAGMSRQLPIISAAIAYAVSFSYTDAPFLTMAYGLGLLYFMLSNYRHSTNTVWLYAGMTLLYPIIIYGFWSANIPHDFWLIATAALGAAQILLLYAPVFDENTRKGIMQIGIAGLSLSTFALILPENIGSFAFMNGADALHVPAILMSLAVFALFGMLELRQTSKSVDASVFLLPVGLAVFGYLVYASSRFYFFGIANYNAFYCIALSLAISLSLAIANRHQPNTIYSFGMTLAFYPALFHLLDFLGVPIEFYPPAIALLSMGLYLARKNIVGEAGANAMSLIILIILGITAVSPYFVAFNNLTYQLYSWAAGYFFLLIFWHSRIVPDRQLREFLLAGAVYVQYIMTLDFAFRYSGYNPIFTDLQWFSAGAALLLLILTLREAHFKQNQLPMPMLYLTAAVALLPAYFQTLTTNETFVYALLGVIYGVIIMGVGIVYRNMRGSGLGVLGLIIAVLIPMGEFILSQEWWVILLTVGLVLIIVAVTLTSLRRNMKKKVLEA